VRLHLRRVNVATALVKIGFASDLPLAGAASSVALKKR
jgi:hypothetical protein